MVILPSGSTAVDGETGMGRRKNTKSMANIRGGVTAPGSGI